MEPFTLRTNRLVLRPFEPADIDEVFDYAGDEEFGRYVPTVPHPYQRRHAEEFVAAAAACDWTCNPHLAVEFGGRVIGGTNLRIDDAQTAGLGYAIGRDWWGRELGTETARAMVGCAFTTYEVAVVWATADMRNVASRRVLERIGMRLDGVLRQRRLHRGERVDECHYSLLRSEWNAEG